MRHLPTSPPLSAAAAMAAIRVALVCWVAVIALARSETNDENSMLAHQNFFQPYAEEPNEFDAFSQLLDANAKCTCTRPQLFKPLPNWRKSALNVVPNVDKNLELHVVLNSTDPTKPQHDIVVSINMSRLISFHEGLGKATTTKRPRTSKPPKHGSVRSTRDPKRGKHTTKSQHRPHKHNSVKPKPHPKPLNPLNHVADFLVQFILSAKPQAAVDCRRLKQLICKQAHALKSRSSLLDPAVLQEMVLLILNPTAKTCVAKKN